ncbi:MAG: helix-turn-helix transcriptional regulator [Candidatus Heimdallarchaeota archaeon]
MDTDKLGWMDIATKALSQLLFELSHGERLKTLLLIRDQAQRHTELTKQLKMSPQETSRHLLRLTEAKLIERDVERIYHLTNLGHIVLTCISSLNVIAKYSDFFLTHEISGIPYEFILRLGELSNSIIRQTDTLSTVSKAIQAIKNTKGQIFLMNVGRLEHVDSIIRQLNNKEFKCILPTTTANNTLAESKWENCRYLDKIKLVLLITNDIAAIALPDLTGKMDYSNILWSNDFSFKKWCKDLFEYYWMTAKVSSTY